MPRCSRCNEMFHVEEEPGAVMMGAPKNLTSISRVWKAHICHGCEMEIIKDWKNSPYKPPPPPPKPEPDKTFFGLDDMPSMKDIEEQQKKRDALWAKNR